MKKNNNDIPLKILLLLKKKDRPLIANHIAKGINERPQIVDYHLKILTEKGIVLITEEFGSKQYLLQPNFYLEDAETALMQLLLPWVQEFSKQTDIHPYMKGSREDIVLNNLEAYWLIFLQNIKKDLKK